MNDSKFPQNIVFPQLESLLVSSVSSDTSNYSAFIGQQLKLRKLQFGEMVFDEGLQNMIGNLPHLTEAIINIVKNVQSETISKFLQSCGALKRLDLIFSSETFTDAIDLKIQQLAGMLNDVWTIESQDKIVSFIRKYWKM